MAGRGLGRAVAGLGLQSTRIVRMHGEDARALEGHVDGGRRCKTQGRRAKLKDAMVPLGKLLILTPRGDCTRAQDVSHIVRR